MVPRTGLEALELKIISYNQFTFRTTKFKKLKVLFQEFEVFIKV